MRSGLRIVVAIVVFCLCAALGHAEPEYSWVPVDASAAFETTAPGALGRDTEISFVRGTSGLIVEFEVRLHGWGSAPGSPTLGTAQASIDTSSLLGMNADPPQPGLDLSLLNNQPWRENPGGNGRNDGLYTVVKTCQDTSIPLDLDIPCASIPGTMSWPPCGGFPIQCERKPDWPFGFFVSTVPVTTWDSIGWAGITNAGDCVVDTGTTNVYLGTLVLNVPEEFEGTFTLEFDTGPASTFLNDCWGSAIHGIAVAPGMISVGGACCSPGGSCTFATESECTIAGGTSIASFCEGDTDGDGVDAVCGDPCPIDNPDDTDGDGVCDSVDRCPGFDDSIDSDGDGVSNGCDLCNGVDDAAFGPECDGAIPTISAWGLVVLTLMVLVGGKIYFGSRGGHRNPARRGS